MINVLIIILSIVYIWEFSGFIEDLTRGLFNWRGYNYLGQQLNKPFSCYLCVIFWSTFLYSIFSVGLLKAIGVGVVSSLIGLLARQLIELYLRLIQKIK
jgi:hypothetical protein